MPTETGRFGRVQNDHINERYVAYTFCWTGSVIEMSDTRPFLKWAGGKYQILDRIRGALPPGRRLIEPFVGSGAVFLNTEYSKYLLGDANHDLIDLYQRLASEGGKFVRYAHQYFRPKYNNGKAFYEMRATFNGAKASRRRAALFLYLNRHCYNGLCRYNSKGEFNTPFGKYKAPYFPEKELTFFATKAKHAVFAYADFKDTMRRAKEGDVVYCDPPYVPLSDTANFADYAPGGFGQVEHIALASLAEELSERGVTVVISNHSTEFVRKAYRKAKTETFDVRRYISCVGDSRGTASEVLAIFGG